MGEKEAALIQDFVGGKLKERDGLGNLGLY
jgi:hypothetical protein